MKAITIRNVPDDLYRLITRLTKRNRRSIQQEVLSIVERARILDNESPVERARDIRQRFDGRELGDSVEEIRRFYLSGGPEVFFGFLNSWHSKGGGLPPRQLPDMRLPYPSALAGKSRLKGITYTPARTRPR